jgi:hypothetical protein
MCNGRSTHETRARVWTGATNQLQLSPEAANRGELKKIYPNRISFKELPTCYTSGRQKAKLKMQN